MEWKEEGIKAAYIGVIGVIGSILGGKFKPFFKKIKKVYREVDSIDKLNNDTAYNRSQMIIMQNRIQALFHTSYEPLFICNIKGDLIYANPSWQKMTGFIHINDAYGLGYLRAIPPEDREVLESTRERLAAHPGSFEDVVRFRYIYPPHNIIITECRTETVNDENGKPVEVIGRLKIIL